MYMRKCAKCGNYKDKSEFNSFRKKNRRFLQYGYCKSCHAETYRISYCEQMSDKYIIRALKEQGFYDPPSEIIIVKRELIRLKRTIWQILKT